MPGDNRGMKWLLCILVSLGSAGSALSSAVGDTYDQVIAEKGKPTSHIEAGVMQILKYPDATIKLKDNVVVSIRPPEPVSQASGVPAAPRPIPAAVSPPVQVPEPVDPDAKVRGPPTTTDRSTGRSSSTSTSCSSSRGPTGAAGARSSTARS